MGRTTKNIFFLAATILGWLSPSQAVAQTKIAQTKIRLATFLPRGSSHYQVLEAMGQQWRYPAIVIEVPLLVPLGAAYGIDPIRLGIIFSGKSRTWLSDAARGTESADVVLSLPQTSGRSSAFGVADIGCALGGSAPDYPTFPG